MLEINVEGIEGVVSVTDGERPLGEQKIVTFANGYQASIVDHAYSYGTELAVVRDGVVTYDTPVTDDVLPHLTDIGLRLALEKIAALPDAKDLKHFEYYEVRSMAQKVRDEFGSDHMTEQCVYVRREDTYDENGMHVFGDYIPVCYVGQILVRKGVSAEILSEMSVLSYERQMFKEKGITFSDKAYFFLDTLQAIQDSGHNWGISLQIAQKVTERRDWSPSDQSLNRL